MRPLDSRYDCGHQIHGVRTKSDSAWILPCGHTLCSECALELTSCPVCGKQLGKDEGIYPLHDAARTGAWEVMERLVKGGCDVQGKDDKGLTPLHLAARHGHCKAAETLMSLGADVEKTSADGVTPLQRAAGNGRLDLVRLLQSRGARVESGTETWKSPLHLAARAASVEVMAFLIEHGADPNSKSKDGTTPLHLAVAFGNRDSARFLLSRGAEVRAACCWDSGVSRTFGTQALSKPPGMNELDGGTPLQIAAARGDLEMTDLLVGSGAEMEMMAAASVGMIQYVQEALIHDKALARTRGLAGNTPLHLAARTGALDMVKLLVGFTAEIDARNDREETPLHLGSYSGHMPVVDFLCGQGADVNAKTRCGETALYLAAGRGAASVVQLLLEHGAEVEANCSWSAPTPLSIAAHAGHLKTVELLISRGANGLVRSRFGDALEDLVPSGNEEVVTRLRAYRIGCLEQACLRTDRRLLWIDDYIGDFHASILQFAADMGFGLAEAASSDEALVLIQDLQRPPGKCLTAEETSDGELSGLAFYSRHARRLRPDLPCIFVTANPADEKLLAALSNWPLCRVASKPLDWGLLGKLVQELTGIEGTTARRG